MRHTTISRSSAEVEYRNSSSTMVELVWLLEMLKDLDADIKQPMNIYSDSKATIQLVANPIYHERTNHIEIDCHFIREKLQQGLITVSYISIKYQNRCCVI